jgi:hypothetical protein
MNYKIRKLKDDLISVLNASDVPIEAKRLILAEISDIVLKKSDEIIALEIQFMKEEQENVSVHENELAEHTEHEHTA